MRLSHYPVMPKTVPGFLKQIADCIPAQQIIFLFFKWLKLKPDFHSSCLKCRGGSLPMGRVKKNFQFLQWNG
jgi:hypothetical protein